MPPPRARHHAPSPAVPHPSRPTKSLPVDPLKLPSPVPVALPRRSSPQHHLHRRRPLSPPTPPLCSSPTPNEPTHSYFLGFQFRMDDLAGNDEAAATYMLDAINEDIMVNNQQFGLEEVQTADSFLNMSEDGSEKDALPDALSAARSVVV